MQDVLSFVLSYVKAAWRHRWLAMAVAWAIAVIGWTVVYQLPDRYQASARVYVDTRSILRPLLRGLAIQTDVSHQLRLMTRLMLTRENLEKVARMTDLDLTVQSPQQMDDLVERLRQQISLSGDDSRRSDNIYTIACEHEDPQLAKRIVQSLLTLFVERSLGDSRKDSDSARRFLDKQIADYQQRLEEAEQRLKEFKRENFDLLPKQGGDYYSQLTEARARLNEAHLVYNEAQHRRDELRRQLEGETPSFGLFDGNTRADFRTQYDERIKTLEAELDQLLLKYTEHHPSVTILRDTLEELKRKQAAEFERLRANSSGSGSLNENPVYQQMRIALGEAEAAVASIGARVNEYRRRVEELQQRVDAGLEVEAKLKGLNRDYEIVKENYDVLIEKRETAKLSEEVEQRSDNVKFKILEPPRVPIEPAAPNRPMLLTFSLVASVAAGIGLAVLLSLIRPTFVTRHMISQETGYPILGIVSMNWTSRQLLRRKLNLAAYVVSGLILLGAYGSLLTLQLTDIDVSRYLAQITGGLL